MSSARGRYIAMGAAVALAAALTACAAEEPAPEPTTPAPTPTVEPEATPTPEPVVWEFELPTACADILPEERKEQFANLKMKLLAGPDGLYGDQYLAEPTPEQLAGGITCIWGDEDVPENSVVISVAPLDLGNRSAIVTSLVDQGLNEQLVDGVVLYGREGDGPITPAIVNLIRNDSWISVIEGLGGPDFYLEAREIADEVSGLVGAGGPLPLS